MSIQSNVNQLLAMTAAGAYGISKTEPFKAHQTLNAAKPQAKAIDNKISQMQSEVDKNGYTRETQSVMAGLFEESAALNKKIAGAQDVLGRTGKSLESTIEGAKGFGTAQDLRQDLAINEGTTRLTKKQDAIREREGAYDAQLEAIKAMREAGMSRRQAKHYAYEFNKGRDPSNLIKKEDFK